MLLQKRGIKNVDFIILHLYLIIYFNIIKFYLCFIMSNEKKSYSFFFKNSKKYRL